MTSLTAADKMSGLVMLQCARGDHDSGVAALDRSHSRRRRLRRKHRHSVSLRRSGFYVKGPWRVSQGASFVLKDWKVRVLWLFGIVDRPSKHIYVRTITMSGCVDRRSRYNHPKNSTTSLILPLSNIKHWSTRDGPSVRSRSTSNCSANYQLGLIIEDAWS